MKKLNKIPRSLKIWFIMHFWIDIFFAIPLLLIPEVLLSSIGWTIIDPLSSRLVGAALFGIGITSLIERNADAVVFKSLLNLKILWSSAAIFGIGVEIAMGAPPIAWLFFGIFTAFLSLWSYYRIKLLAS